MGEDNNEPTGHLLSSQVACINHLYFARQRSDVATALLKGVSGKIIEAVKMDDGYVEFEVIGRENYLGERSHTRGTNCTSVDAAMVGRKKDGSSILVLIEWKYTEEYSSKSLYISERSNLYDPLLSNTECPIKVYNYESLYYEPFYQLMRQTLLGWKMVQTSEYGCNEYIHLHVVPERNLKLKERVTSSDLTGSSMSDAWMTVLKEPERYIVISPEEFIKPASSCVDTYSVLKYLEKRYW